MSDFLSREERSRLMSKIRGKNTSLEEKFFLLLKEAGIRFRRHPKGIFGRPDAANKSKKLAIFLDSEFWHGHDWKIRKADLKSNKKFWIEKIERNIERDKEVNRKLKKDGWTVVRIWTRQLKKREVDKTLKKLRGIAEKISDS